MYIACLWIPRIGIAAERARLPLLAEEPLLVLLDAEGVVKACTPEVALYGIKTGQTASSARGLCPDLVTLTYDGAAYELSARRAWDELAIESDRVEPISPEMCYVEMHGSSVDDIGDRLRTRVAAIETWVGTEVYVGLGRSKFVARLAARLERPSQAVVRIGDEALFLAGLPIADLPKADPKICQQLRKLGVNTLGDAWRLPASSLPSSLRPFGRQLSQWRNGFDADPVRPAWPPRTSAASLTFDAEESNLLSLEKALFQISERIALDLAKRREYCRELTLKVELEDRNVLFEKNRLSLPESRAAAIQRAAVRLLHRMTIEKPILSIEIIASELANGSGVQLSLMDLAGELPRERANRLDSALKHLRQRFGVRAIVMFSLLMKARRIHNWMSPLSYQILETLPEVSTNALGEPFRYLRSMKTPGSRRRGEQRLYRIVRIHNQWRESGKLHGVVVDAEVWRVETEPFAVCELRRIESDWCLTGAWD